MSFWNLVHGVEAWEQARATAYGDLSLPSNADDALGRVRDDLAEAAKALVAGIDDNPFAAFVSW